MPVLIVRRVSTLDLALAAVVLVLEARVPQPAPPAALSLALPEHTLPLAAHAPAVRRVNTRDPELLLALYVLPVKLQLLVERRDAPLVWLEHTLHRALLSALIVKLVPRRQTTQVHARTAILVNTILTWVAYASIV